MLQASIISVYEDFIAKVGLPLTRTIKSCYRAFMKLSGVFIVGILIVGCGSIKLQETPPTTPYCYTIDSRLDRDSVIRAVEEFNDFIGEEVFNYERDNRICDSRFVLNPDLGIYEGMATVDRIPFKIQLREPDTDERDIWHVIGHVFGLLHVKNKECLMNPIVYITDLEDDECGIREQILKILEEREL